MINVIKNKIIIQGPTMAPSPDPGSRGQSPVAKELRVK